MKSLFTASNEISINPQTGRSRREDSPTIRGEDLLYVNTPYIYLPVIIASFS